MPVQGSVRLAAAAVGMLLLAALAAGSSPVHATATHDVTIENFAYAPEVLTISVGDTVRWTNRDAIGHNAAGTTGSWDTGILEENESATITFSAPGTYDYLCTPHPNMTGRIVVLAKEAAATPSPSVPPAAGTDTGGSLPDVAMSRPALVGPGLLATVLLVGLVAAAGVIRPRRVPR